MFTLLINVENTKYSLGGPQFFNELLVTASLSA